MADKPRASKRVHNSSAIPHPSSVTTTVPEISNAFSIPRHSSTSTCHLRQPEGITVGCEVMVVVDSSCSTISFGTDKSPASVC